jgi:hypothetical protein
VAYYEIEKENQVEKGGVGKKRMVCKAMKNGKVDNKTLVFEVEISSTA